MQFLLELAWRDLRGSGRSLWVFCACLVLGVTLVSASGSLYRLTSIGLLADTRAIMGGDLEVESHAPLPAEVLDWMRANGRVSRVTELYTMLGTEQGDFLRVELQSMDQHYPLYGELELEPAGELAAITALRDGHWGLAIDPALALRLDLALGDMVSIGTLQLQVRALLRKQPDRRLNADWRGPPVLLSSAALEATGLIQPGSRVDYDYRVATARPAGQWRQAFYQRFAGERWEITTFEDRSERIAERLGQIASGLLIIGFSTLFIGGLGVFNSIQSYLQGKLKTIATLRTLGLRNRRLATVYLLQVGILAGSASLAGCIAGSLLAMLGAGLMAAKLPVEATLGAVLQPNLVALLFGLLTAFSFALPAIGRALAISPAALFRQLDGSLALTPRGWWLATLAGALAIALLVLLAMPDPWFGAGFVAVVTGLLGLLEIAVRVVRRAARALDRRPARNGDFALRLALANLYRPGSPLRSALLSLGSALTLLVACTLVVASLLRSINTTIPEESPALVLYDIGNDQLPAVSSAVAASDPSARLQTAPLVRARILEVNGKPMAEHLPAGGEGASRAARNDYKLSYRAGNIDNLTIVEGAWWQDDPGGTTPLAIEDREAGRLDLALGDRLRFGIEGQAIDAEIVAIYTQKGLQTRFWFEGILPDGALDAYIHRHVGAAFMDETEADVAQRRIGAAAPNVVSVRTAALLEMARGLLGQAATGLTVVAGVSLAASLLVLVSVMAAGRSRQVYDATVLATLGARMSVIRHSLRLEYLLLALLTSIFAILLGSAIALSLLHFRLKLPGIDLVWLGALTAFGVSGLSASLGARYLLRRLRLRPAVLLRSAG